MTVPEYTIYLGRYRGIFFSLGNDCVVSSESDIPHGVTVSGRAAITISTTSDWGRFGIHRHHAIRRHLDV